MAAPPNRAGMDEPVTRRLYNLWAWFYDYTFGALVHKRQQRALRELPLETGQRVLDLGVGTGMTLGHYPEGITVVGMDLSEGMLEKANEKIRREELRGLHLVRGDAMRPPFADEAFDHILCTHTVSVVSDAATLMRFARRLLKPGGTLVVLNHFRSPNPVLGFFERVLNPVFVRIGWRSDLSLDEVLEPVSEMPVERCFQHARIDLWKIVVLRRPAADAGAQAPDDARTAASA